MIRLEDPIEIGGLEVPNRLYRAPLLECAGTDSGTADRLVRELEPAAASGVGLVMQGATIVRPESGCPAPEMTRVHDPAFVSELAPVPEAIGDHGGRVFCQLEHGGLRSMEIWHSAYRERHPEFSQLAVSEPPRSLRALDRLGVFDMDVRVLSTAEVRELARDFGRSAGYLVDAGYDGIHIAGANMGIVQQFLSPYYNRRNDEFGDGVSFLEYVHDAIREFAGDVPLITKVPVETEFPRPLRRRLTLEDGVAISRRLERIGYDGLVPVMGSPFWDVNLVRGKYPERAWRANDLQSGYEAAFGGHWRARAVAAVHRLQSRLVEEEPAWNRRFCRRVREAVSIPVCCEGGIRTREEIDRLLDPGIESDGAHTSADPPPGTDTDADPDPAADLIGLGRPFYAEPRLGARLLDHDGGRSSNGHGDTDGTILVRDRDEGRALCRNCNNCTIPQVAGVSGTCRTPSIVRERARLEKEGVYDD
jgi:2,4-dienoyl-CoA reductase-like NADH-dependent reductase (Old Yellow Enzyme family)